MATKRLLAEPRKGSEVDKGAPPAQGEEHAQQLGHDPALRSRWDRRRLVRLVLLEIEVFEDQSETPEHLIKNKAQIEG